jgi:hypothetical protein
MGIINFNHLKFKLMIISYLLMQIQNQIYDKIIQHFLIFFVPEFIKFLSINYHFFHYLIIILFYLFYFKNDLK